MASSVVNICNLALQRLGANRITDITGASVEARACNNCYEELRLAELQDHNWVFAITRASLAANASAPAFGKARSFPLPTGFLRLIDDYPEDRDFDRDFEIEGNEIYTDFGAPLKIRYVQDVTDPNVMHPLFRLALAYRMADQMCEEVTQSNTKKELVQKDYDRTVARARKSNAIMRIPQEAPEDPWLTVRR